MSETNPPERSEISEEARLRAERFVLDSVGAPADSALKEFPERLASAIRDLPRFRDLVEQLADEPPSTVGYRVFQLLRRSADPALFPPGPEDGVLIPSMRTGRLECAGRSAIASLYLRERGIAHTVAAAPGHSLLIIEMGSDTLAYCDHNNDLYFTFPRSAAGGYAGADRIAEVTLSAFAPRDLDVLDGTSVAFTRFVTLPPGEGIARQYLWNATAALSGKPEFAKSGIADDAEASDAVGQFDDEIYGSNEVLDSFLKKTDELRLAEETLERLFRSRVGELYRLHPSRDDFVVVFADEARGPLGQRLPYLQQAPNEARRRYAARLWEFCQNPAVLREIGYRE